MPKIVLTTEELPEIADWENGETYNVTLELKQIRGGADRKSFEIISAQSEYSDADAETKGMMPTKDEAPEEQMVNGGNPMRKKMIERIGQKAKTY